MIGTLLHGNTPYSFSFKMTKYLCIETHPNIQVFESLKQRIDEQQERKDE